MWVSCAEFRVLSVSGQKRVKHGVKGSASPGNVGVRAEKGGTQHRDLGLRIPSFAGGVGEKISPKRVLLLF